MDARTTVVVVEHDMRVIAGSDWVIDIGLPWWRSTRGAAPRRTWRGCWGEGWRGRGLNSPFRRNPAPLEWRSWRDRTSAFGSAWRCGGPAFTAGESFQGKGSQDGTLYIVQDESIPTGKLSCGIGMNRSGIYAVQAEPNETAEFTPHPVYWITFGNHVHGEVLDVTTITNAAQVVFPPNVSSVTATLTSQNTWIIQ